MMKLRVLSICFVLQCGSVLVVAQTPAPSAAPSAAAKSSTQPAKAAASHAVPVNEGERKFRQNCSRCHNAPDELPTRITGTVLLHMRVRASLSEAEQRAILHYLAP
jgi:cytochrome c5